MPNKVTLIGIMGPLLRIAAPFLAVVLLSILLILWLMGGAEAEVRQVYEEMLAAGQAYDADKLVSRVSRDYQAGGARYDGAVQMIRDKVKPGAYHGLQEAEAPEIKVLEDSASIDARVRARVDPLPYPGTFQVKVLLRKEGGRWMVTSIEARHAPKRE